MNLTRVASASGPVSVTEFTFAPRKSGSTWLKMKRKMPKTAMMIAKPQTLIARVMNASSRSTPREARKRAGTGRRARCGSTVDGMGRVYLVAPADSWATVAGSGK